MHPKLIKQCPNRSRVVPDTEYITNLGTINLKIEMLGYTFCTPLPAPPPRSSRSLHLEQRKYSLQN